MDRRLDVLSVQAQVFQGNPPSICPQTIQIIVATQVPVEDMEDHGPEVQEDPAPELHSFVSNGGDAAIGEAVLHMRSNGLHMATRRARTEHDQITIRSLAFDIQDNQVFSFFVICGRGNQPRKLQCVDVASSFGVYPIPSYP